ncbi:MAG TPA: integrase [Roseateles sp.]|uniref:site-specific integrase n=1 Tax=Roseateles sp. TaxID=1971397 RepID=UPI002EDB2A6A
MVRTRDRKSAEGLLPRMEAIPGKKKTLYRYHPVGQKPISLGHDRLEACKRVLDMLGEAPDHGTVKWVWGKYQESKRFLRLAESTKDDYRQCSIPILACFGHRRLAGIDAPMIAYYVREHRKDAEVRANREKSLLSNLFAHGIDLGVCKENPAKQVRPNIEEPRTEAPDAAVLQRFLVWVARQTAQQRIVGLAAEYAALAGNRKAEFLDLVWPQIDRPAKEVRDQVLSGAVEASLGVVRVKRAKQRGKKRGEVIEEIKISPALNSCLDRLEAIRTNRECLYVFPTRGNNAYTARGFKAMWQKLIVKAVEKNIVPADERFTFHDLRAFYATVHKDTTGTLPDLHKNPATTAQVYDRTKIVRRASN